MPGKMATNDLSERPFAGVTAQVQCYWQIDMFSEAAVSDVDRNDFLSRPLAKKEMEADECRLFHDFPEELKVTLALMATEDAHPTRQLNNEALEQQRKMKEKKEELEKQTENEKNTDKYIESLIYHSMYKSDACWKTVGEVTADMKKLKFKKDKMQSLKDNIQIRYKGFGWID